MSDITMPDETPPTRVPVTAPAGRMADLRVRLMSGAVLVLVALGALTGGTYAFGAVVTIFQAAALGLASLLIGTLLVMALLFGNRPTLSALGVLYTGLPAVALIWMHADAPLGIAAIVLLIIIVATTDTFAFFSGRLIG